VRGVVSAQISTNRIRAGRPGEICACGRPAAVVLVSPNGDEISTCIRLDTGRRIIVHAVHCIGVDLNVGDSGSR
jgi:hypothetical protein